MGSSSGTRYSGYSAAASSAVGGLFPAVPSRQSNVPSQNYLHAGSNQANKAFKQTPSISSAESSSVTRHSRASYNGFSGNISTSSGVSGNASRGSPKVEEISPSNSSVASSSGNSSNQVNDSWPFNNDRNPFEWAAE